MITIIKCKKSHPLGPIKQRKLLVMRAFFGSIGLVTFFFAFKLLEPSDCLAITHTSVIITSILARIILKEKLTIAHLIAVLLTVAGVILIAKPAALFGNLTQLNKTALLFSNCSTNETTFLNCSAVIESDQNSFNTEFYTTIGIIIALFCSLCSSTVQILLKKLSTQKVHYSIVIIYVTYVGIPVTLAISVVMALTGLSHKNFPNNLHKMPLQILYVTISAVLGIFSQILLNFSLKYEEASKVAIFRTLDVFFTFLFQYVFLNISLDIFSFIGSSSILMGTFLILSFKLVENRMVQKNNTNSNKNDEINSKKQCQIFYHFINFKF